MSKPDRLLFLLILVFAHGILLLLAASQVRANPADPAIGQATYNEAVAGYVLVRGAGAVDEDFSYSRAGGIIDVTHLATGTYSVFFVDAASNIEGNGHVQVTPIGANVHCPVRGWDTFGANNYRVDLLCLDNDAGERVNSDFSMLVLDEGGGNNPNLAFTYSQERAPAGGELDLTNSDDTYNPGGGQTVLFHTGTGRYSIVFHDLGQVMHTTAHVQITPVTSGFMGDVVISCGVAAQWEFIGGNLTVPVQCSDLDGNPLDATFNVLVTSGEEVAPGFAYALNDVLDEAEFTELTNDYVYNPFGDVLARRLNGLDGYLLHFLGVTTENGGNIVVTPYAAPGTSCAILDWRALNSGEGLTVQIRCFSASRTHVDAMFTVLSTFVDASPAPEQRRLYLPIFTR